MTSSALPKPASAIRNSSQSAILRDIYTMTKPRLSLLAGIIAAAGYQVAGAHLGAAGLIHAFLGTLVVSGGAMALNMVLERELDSKMERTRDRPIAAGRLSAEVGLIFGVLMSILGMAWLYIGTSPAAAAMGALAVFLYVVIYTPLKPVSNLCTIVGAIPGALPPVIGWTAASGTLDFGAIILFAIMFLWQMPHFLAIAWLCREDYARAGMPMLSVIDQEGKVTGRQIIIYTIALIPVTILPTLVGLTGWTYAVLSTAANVWFMAQAVRWMKSRHDRTEARKLFGLSLIQITVIFLLMVVDKA